MKVILLVLSAVALAAADKRFLLDTIQNEHQKYLECEQKSSQPECSKCCNNQFWPYPGEQAGCWAVCLTLPATAPSTQSPQKRLVLDTIVGEQQKYLECEEKATKHECDTCCMNQHWLYPGEQAGCMGTCWALPLTAAGGSQ